MRRRTWVRFFACVLVAVAFNTPAETLEQKYEYARRIQAAQAVGALGSNLFGDEVNYYNGATTFTQVDVDLPGNSALPVRIARTWSTASPEGPTAPGLFGEWELDIPVMHGVFARSTGWRAGSTLSSQRCTVPDGIEPGVVYNAQGNHFAGSDYWRGNFLYVPGAGDQQLLAAGGWKTPAHWRVDCLTGLANGQSGEGFLAIAPDGTKYTFNWMVSRPYSTLQRSESLGGPAGGTVYFQLLRDEVRIYPTRVEDRFGNSVTYTYSGEKVTEIRANDGRVITLAYNAQDAIETVTAAGKVWRYEYSAYRRLLRVVQPDQSAWSFGTGGAPTLVMVYQPEQANSGCNAMGEWSVGAESFSMIHPSGAVGLFTFAPTRHARSNISYEQTCRVTEGLLEYGPPRQFDNFALTDKTISGPGLPSMQWSVGYPTPCVACTTKAVALTNPDQSVTRHTFGTQYYVDEGKLLRTETLTTAGALLRDEAVSYATTASDPSYSYWVGSTGMTNPDAFGSTTNVPRVQTTITQQGTTFTNQVNDFDSFVRPLEVRRFSSLGYDVTDFTAYHDDLDIRVLGQVKQTTAAGVVTSETSYDPTTALPVWSKSFGKLQHTLGYYADGTLRTIKDGRNYVITLSSWKRGTPQVIAYPDASAESAVVNDDGTIASATDENGYTTSYGYDAMGRLDQVTHPVGDSTAWNATTQAFQQIAATEYGIPAGHWRQTVSTGNARKITYFDGLWRPLVTREYDAANVAGTQRFTRRAYDLAGREAFASYPGAIDALTTGIRTTYDVLGRPVTAVQDSEWGPLTTTTEYLTGFQTKVTNPRNQATYFRYQAYDQPTTDLLERIVQPEDAYTYILRNAFGKPTRVIRRNAAGTVAVGRYYVYDLYQQLCKRVEPETGATVMDYDAGGNLAWSASGLSLTSTTSCETASVPAPEKAIRSYDPRNRIKTLNFVDGNGSQSWDYTPDGLPETVTTLNDSGTTSAINAYTYNRRRLPTGESLSQSGVYSWGVGYGYNGNGHLVSHTYPQGLTVDYAPNALGQPTRAGTYATGASYYPNGALKGFTYGNGIVHSLTQNARGLPERSRDAYGATAVHDDSYDFDANGNVAAISDGLPGARGNRDMTYDGLDRLTGTTSPMFATAMYGYDVLDNLRTLKIGTRNHTYDYDNAQRLTNVRDTISGATVIGLGYDLQGNLANKNGVVYDFDTGNRLRDVSGKESYRYDAHGRRIQATHPTTGSIYSMYGQDGVLRYQEDYRKRLKTHYVYLQGSLVAEVANVAPATAVPTLSAPTSSNNGSFTVVWSGIADGNRYPLDESVNGGAWVQIADTSALSWSASGKSNGSYRYRVRGCAMDCSAYSSIVTVTVDRMPDSAPALTAPAYVTQGGYTVQWTVVSLATRYELQEQDNGAAWVLIHNAAATSAAITGQATGLYDYRVRGCNAQGCGPWSTSKTVAVELPPAAPPSLTVPASGLNGAYTVNWGSAPAADSYTLQESANGGAWSGSYSGTAQSKAYSGRAAGSYAYRIQACNPGGCSAFSSSDSVQVIYPPATAPTPSAPSQGLSGDYTVTWTTVSGATSYRLEESANGGAWVRIHDAVATSKVLANKPTGDYAYRVNACNAAGCGPFSGSVSVQVIYPPATASTPSAPAQNTSGAYTVSWSAVGTATSYRLEESENGGAWILIHNAAATSKALSGQTAGDYSYRVRACNVAGCGAVSGTRAVEVIFAPATAPALTVPATNTTGAYSVSWTAVATASTYQLLEQAPGGGWVSIHNAAGTSSGVSSLVNGVYGYQVRACNVAGCGPYAPVKSVSVAQPPPATPSGLYVSKEYEGSWTCDASWNAASKATSYQLQEGSTVVHNGPATSWGRSSNCTVSFTVKACNAYGCSAWSAAVAPVRVMLSGAAAPEASTDAEVVE